jgi:hypothetical protein
MKTRILMAAMTLVLTATAGQAGLQLDLTYAFEVGTKRQACVTAQIGSVEMGAGVPLAVTGSATMDVTLEVTAIDELGVATILVTFDSMSAELMGRPQQPARPAPVSLRVDRKGQVLDTAAAEGPQLDLFAGGGVPLQLVVLLAGVVELPATPIAIGDSWTLERSQTLPQVGEIRTRVTSQLGSISAAEAVVVTDVEASFPDFTTTNPIQDNQITVRNGVLTVGAMERKVDARTGLISAIEADIAFNGIAAIGEFVQLPLAVTSSFVIEAR